MTVEQDVQKEQAQQKDSDDAFAAGFGESRGVELPAPTAKAEPAPEAKVESAEESTPKVETPAGDAAPAKELTPDPWADVSPVVKATLESTAARVAELDKQQSDRLRKVEGRLGDINSQLKAALAAKSAAEKSGAEAPTQAEITDAFASSDRLKQVKADYPEWAEAMQELIAPLRGKAPASPEVNVGELEAKFEKRLKDATDQIAYDANSSVVELRYPEWKATINSPAFNEWTAKHAEPDIRVLGDSPHARDAIKMLDAFEAFKKRPKKETTQQRLKDAITPQGDAVSPQPTVNAEEAFNAGYQEVRAG